MTFNRKDIDKVAHLARLEIDETDIQEYASNLSKILDLVNQINSADTTGITPIAHPIENIQQRLREDKVSEEIDRESFQKIAPLTEAGLYLVPKVIEE